MFNKEWKEPHEPLGKCKIILRYRFTATKMATVRTVNKARAGEDVEKSEPSCGAGGKIQWCRCFGEQFAVFVKTLQLPYDPPVLRLVMCSRELKACVYATTCTSVFPVGSSYWLKRGNQANVHQLKNGSKMWYLHTVEYCCAGKRHYWYVR